MRRQEIEKAVATALEHQRQGDLTRAEPLYRKVLKIDPARADAMHFLGILLCGRGDVAEGLKLVARSADLRPDLAMVQTNYAEELRKAGHLEQAAAVLDRAVAAHPRHAKAWTSRASTLLALGRLDEAWQAAERSIALAPGSADAWSTRGLVANGREAAAEALASFERALLLSPGHFDATVNRAAALLSAERFEAALADADAALRMRPGFAAVLATRAHALLRLRRLDEALACLEEAIALHPENIEFVCERGNVHHMRWDIPAAMADFETVTRRDPGHAIAQQNLAITLASVGELDQAWAHIAAAMALAPDAPGIRYNGALVALKRGDLATGWALQEARLEIKRTRPLMVGAPFERWDGTGSLAGETILVYAEQGLGDTLQFCRFVPELVARGARVVLLVQRPLERLLRTLGTGIEVVTTAIVDGRWHIPLLSLPLALRIGIDDVCPVMPYLRADPADVAVWRARLAGLRGLRVGLVWAGSAELGEGVADARRSIGLAALRPLGDVAGVDLVSLQKGPGADQPRPDGLMVHDWSDLLVDFADTAALIMALDLVVTVDTSVAHAAGALGRPVWLLNRSDGCWRWLQGRSDSPWYPGLRIFQQRVHGGWGEVAAEVAVELGVLAQARMTAMS